MAARKRRGTKDSPWDEKVRDKIRASMLVNNVLNHALGKTQKAKMTREQQKSAFKLIDKVLPDLKSVESTGSVNVTGELIVSFGDDDDESDA